MAASTRLPLAALLLSLSCLAAAATGNNNYGGDDGRVLAAAGAAAPNSRWQQRLEEEVAPEFSSLAAAAQDYISYKTLIMNRPACNGGGCAAKGPYTGKGPQCTYADKCRGAGGV